MAHDDEAHQDEIFPYVCVEALPRPDNNMRKWPSWLQVTIGAGAEKWRIGLGMRKEEDHFLFEVQGPHPKKRVVVNASGDEAALWGRVRETSVSPTDEVLVECYHFVQRFGGHQTMMIDTLHALDIGPGKEY